MANIYNRFNRFKVKRIVILVASVWLAGCTWLPVRPTPILYNNLASKEPIFYARVSADSESWIRNENASLPVKDAIDTEKLGQTTTVIPVTLDLFQQAYSESEITQYLMDALPIINNHMQEAYHSEFFKLPELESPLTSYEIMRHDPFKDAQELMTGFDVPKVAYGNPAWVGIDTDRYPSASKTKKNVFIVVDGSEKWKLKFRTAPPLKPFVLEIRLGLIEVTATKRNKKIFDLTDEHILGEQIRLDRGRMSSSEWPINVVAFKGLLYDDQGNLKAAGIEGFLPIYPEDAYGFQFIDINSMIWGQELMHLNDETEYLDAFGTYRWQEALDALVARLTRE